MQHQGIQFGAPQNADEFFAAHLLGIRAAITPGDLTTTDQHWCQIICHRHHLIRVANVLSILLAQQLTHIVAFVLCSKQTASLQAGHYLIDKFLDRAGRVNR